MKDWVIKFLKDNRLDKLPSYSWDEMKKINFFCLEKKHPLRPCFIAFSEILISKLNYRFESKPDSPKQSEENFKLLFSSILADLSKKRFDQLSKKKNVIYIFCPQPAFQKKFGKIRKDLLKLVIFSNEFNFLPWEIGRGIVVHELIHIIENLGDSQEDENKVHETARCWGFEFETTLANEYEKMINRDDKEVYQFLKAIQFIKERKGGEKQ